MQVQRIVRLVLAFGIGLLLALLAYDRSTDPEPRRQRLQEEAVVLEARRTLRDYVSLGGELRIVDPLAPDRKVGKVYIYPTADGWQVSGHYRRAGERQWHPWLMTLDGQNALEALSVRDEAPAIAARAAAEPRFSAKP